MYWRLRVVTNFPPILGTLNFTNFPLYRDFKLLRFPCIEDFEFLNTSHYSEDFAFFKIFNKGMSYTKQYFDFDRFLIFSTLNKVLYKVFAY